MDRRLKQLLKDNDLELVPLPIEHPGYLVHTPPNEPDQVVVNENYTYDEVKKVVYHELGHKLNDGNILGSYKDNYLTHIMCEDCANDIKIKLLVADYASQGYDISASNYVDIARAIGTDDYDKVKNELEKYQSFK